MACRRDMVAPKPCGLFRSSRGAIPPLQGGSGGPRIITGLVYTRSVAMEATEASIGNLFFLMFRKHVPEDFQNPLQPLHLSPPCILLSVFGFSSLTSVLHCYCSMSSTSLESSIVGLLTAN